jgi:hypothetical protein
MAELDDRLLRDLARLRDRSSPPPGAEQRVRAALDVAIGPGPGGGDDGGSAFGDGSAFGGLGGTGAGGGKVAFGAKLMAATVATAGAGVLIVKLGMLPAQPAREAATAPVEVSATSISNDEPRSSAQPQLEPEPPILVTPPAIVPVPVQQPSEREEDPLTAEVTLLEQARATDDLTARLELLEQHRERFQTGLLLAERESLRISTLCELDRLDAARQAAEAFLLAHPRSPLRMRMRNACPELEFLAD